MSLKNENVIRVTDRDPYRPLIPQEWGERSWKRNFNAAAKEISVPTDTVSVFF